MGNCSRSAETSCSSKNESCASGSGGCMFSNAPAMSFFIPFVAVTFINHLMPVAQPQAGDSGVCMEILPGVLAGLTSLALYSGIKTLKHRIYGAHKVETPITVDQMTEANATATKELSSPKQEETHAAIL